MVLFLIAFSQLNTSLVEGHYTIMSTVLCLGHVVVVGVSHSVRELAEGG